MRFVLFAVLLSFVLLAACDHPPVPKDLPPDHSALANSNVKQDQLVSSSKATEAPYELQFIDTMIEHDRTVIDAAQLVATRAEHQELKLFAKSMIKARQQEIAELRDLRKRWFGDAGPAVNVDLPGVRDGLQSVDMEKLDSLKENQFDLEFIHQIVPLEGGALTAARDLLTKDIHGEMKQFAQSIVEAHEAEIEQMHGWQTEWTSERG